jgi:hypothetical protein
MPVAVIVPPFGFRPPFGTFGVGHMRRRAMNDSDILVSPHLRPVLLQHLPAERINLDLPPDIPADALGGQIEAANT